MSAGRAGGSKLGRLSLGCGVGAWVLGLAPVAATALLGSELDCFPSVPGPLRLALFAVLPSIVAAIGFAVADAKLNHRRALGGVVLALLVPLLYVFVAPFRSAVADGLIGHSGPPVCEPDGLLGRFPDQWRSLQRAAAREPEPAR